MGPVLPRPLADSICSQDDRCPAHAAAPEVALANLANIPPEPRLRPRLGRLLRSPDGDLPSAPPRSRWHLRRRVPARVKGIGIAEILAAPRSPWQNAFVERVIGSIRREVLDHVIVLNERHLRERLRSYFRYYHASRTHLALDKDAPEPRAVEPPDHGRIVALPLLGGLHHRYVRRAA